MTARASAAEMAALTRSGRLTASDLVARALDAVAELDPVLHFLAEDWSGSALSEAGRVDALPPKDRGPVAGVPFLARAGTTARSPVVGRLMAAGAIAIGASTRPDPAGSWLTAGLPGGLPVGLQAIAAHHRDDLAVAGAMLGAAAFPDPPLFPSWTARLD